MLTDYYPKNKERLRKKARERYQVFLKKSGNIIANENTEKNTIFLSSKLSEKMAFPKKLHWNMIFLVL